MGRPCIIKSEYHQEIIRLYKTGNYSMIELAKMYGATNRQPVITILKQNNVKTIDHRSIQGKDLNRVENMVNDGSSIPEMARQLDVSVKAIRTAINRLDIEYEPQVRTYHFNEHAFDVIDTEEKAYWLGFLYADCHCDRKSTRIGLSQKDLSHLEKLKSFVNGNMPIRKSENEYGKLCTLELNSVHLVTTLHKLGIVPYRGKFHKAASGLSEKVAKHFIRGYIDGDGCITNDFRFVILGQQDILTWIKSHLYQNAGGSNNLNFRQRNGIKEGTWGGRFQFTSIANYLYKDANVYLERKMNRIKKQLNW